MANNPFSADPLANVPKAQFELPELPDIAQPDVPTVRKNYSQNELLGMFTDAAVKHQVPVNVLMAMAEAESGFDVYSTERGKGIMQFTEADAETFGIDPFDPVQSIDTSAKILAERIAKGIPIEEAVIEFHAGEDRQSWNDAARKYGTVVFERAKTFAELFPSPEQEEEQQVVEVKPYQQVLETEGPITWDQYKTGMQSIEQSFKQLKPPSQEEVKRMKEQEQSILQLEQQIEQTRNRIREEGQNKDNMATLRAQTLIYERRANMLRDQVARYNADIENFNDSVKQLQEAEKQLMQKEQVDVDASFVEELKDNIASFGMGSAALVDIGGSIYGLFTGDMENWGTRHSETMRNYYKGMQSESLKQAQTIKQAKINMAEGQFEKFTTALYETVKSPELFSSFIIEQIPMLASTGGVGSVVAKSAQLANVGIKTAGTLNVGSQVLTGAVMQGADVGADAYSQIMNLNGLQAKVAANKAYQELVASGVSPEAAEQQVAVELSRLAAIKAGITSLGLQALFPASRTIERTLGGVGDDIVSPLQGAIRGGLGEGLTEGAEEGLGGYFTNVAVSGVEPNQDLLAGVGQRTAEGVVGAAPFGAAAGATTGLINQRQQQQGEEFNVPPSDFDLTGGEDPLLNGGGGAQTQGQQQTQQQSQPQQDQQQGEVPTEPRFGMAQGDIVNLEAQGDQIDAMFEGIDNDGNYIFRAADGMQFVIGQSEFDSGNVAVNKLGGEEGEERREQPTSSSEVVTQDGAMQQDGVPTPEGGVVPQQTGQMGDGGSAEGAAPTDGEAKPVNVATDEQVEALAKKQFGSKPAAQKAIDENGLGDSFEVVKSGNKWVAQSKKEQVDRPSTQAEVLSGEPIDDEWTSFSDESDSLNIDRANMPQVKAENRGAMVNFLKGKGVESRKETVTASTLKPTQREFSPQKVQAALEYEGGERSILISSDNRVIDGHHQWLSKAPSDEIDVIRIDAPAEQIINQLKGMPSVETDTGMQQTETTQTEATITKGGQPQLVKETKLKSPVKPVSQEESVSTPSGNEVKVQYAIVDANDLVTSNLDDGRVNPDYPKILQPRDRSRAASTQQINDIANKLNPAMLAQSAVTSDGAPIISPEGVVESGNGRVLGIKKAYQKEGESKQRYIQYLKDQGYDIEGITQPVLVRIRTTEMNDQELIQYTRDSNERTTLSMSASEQAQVDADAIMNIIDDYQGGDITSVANNSFVKKFMASVPESSRADLMADRGGLSQTGVRRIQAGLMQAAYGDGELIQQMFESTDNDIKAIGGAMLDAAGYWAKMRSADANGAIADGLDITPNLIEAVSLIRKARQSGMKIAELVNQDDIFAGGVPELTKDFVRLMYRGANYSQARSQQKVASGLVGYAQAALNTNAGEGLFGDVVTANQLVEQQNEKIEQLEQPAKQSTDLFSGSGLTPFGTEKGGRSGQGPKPSAPRQQAEQRTSDETTEAEQTEPLEDFGEKIGGARKDMPPLRSLDGDLEVDQIAKMPLSKVWNKKDIDQIEDVEVAAWMTAIREQIPAKPRASYKVARWAQTAKQARDLGRMYIEDKGRILDKLQDPRFESVANTVYAKAQVLTEVPRSDWGRIGKVEAYPNAGKGPTVLVEIDGRREFYDYKNDIDEAARKVAAIITNKEPPKQQKSWDKLFTVRTDTRNGVTFIHRKVDSEQTRLIEFTEGDRKARVKQAFAYAENNIDELLAKWEEVKERKNVKKADIRSQENRPRIGDDVRKGKDVTPKMFEEQFSFRGVEFGNWVKQGKGTKERQSLLNDIYDALIDLAALLNIPSKALSLGGKLGLGIGSRGRGGFAAAHFERNAFVINLTKTKGAGTLAHEWFHALDNYFARNRDGYTQEDELAFITNKPEPMMVPKPVNGRQMRHTPITKSELERRSQGRGGKGLYNPENWMVDPNHPSGVRKQVEVAFAELVKVLKNSPMYDREKTIDGAKENGYWSKTIEMAARAFESYITNKMDALGARNDFLASVIPVEKFQRDEDRYPYPTQDEMQPIQDAFDNLFKTIEVVDADTLATLNEPSNYYGDNWQRKGDPKLWSKDEAIAYYEDVVKLESDKMNNWAINDLFNTLLPDQRAAIIRVAEQINNIESVAPNTVPVHVTKNVRSLSNRSKRYFKVSDISYDAAVNFEMSVKYIQDTAKFSAQHTKLDYLFDGEPTKREIVKGAEKAIQELQGVIDKSKSEKGNQLSRFKRSYNAQVQQGMYEYLIEQLKNNSIDEARKLVVIRYPAMNQEQIDSGVIQSVINDSIYEVQTSYGYNQQREFQKWFGDSKVVDDQGNPLVVYHGTTADFDVFNVGSFFTQNPSEASAYTFSRDLLKKENQMTKFSIVDSNGEHVGKVVDYVGASPQSEVDSPVDGKIYASDLGVYLRKDGGWQIFSDLGFETSEISDNDKVALKSVDDSANANQQMDEYIEFLNRAYSFAESGGRVMPVYLSIKNPYEMTPFEANLLGKRLNASDEMIADTIENLKSQGYDGIKTLSDEAAFFGGEDVVQWIAFDANQVKSAIGNRGSFDPSDMSILREQDAWSGSNVAAVQQSAWHGSPHYWTQPSLQKIGAGEGVDAYGWGLYFASQKSIAEFYRNAGVRVNPRLRMIWEDNDFDDSQTEKAINDKISSSKGEEADYWRGIMEEFSAAKMGNIYHLDVPENNELLNFNTRYSSQPKKVKDALKPFVDSYYNAIASDIDQQIEALKYEAGESPDDTQKFKMRGLRTKKDIYTNPTGESIYRRLSDQLGGDREASLHLNALGIKGLRYKDANSRMRGDDETYNFVVWDQDAITVKTINGQMVPIGEPQRFGEMDTNLLNEAVDDYQQLSFNLDDLPKIAKDSAKQSRKFASRLQRVKNSIVASKISAEFKEGGATNLIGKTINGATDLAILAQVYRHPALESARFFFVRKGKIVGQFGTTSRMADASKIYPDNMSQAEFFAHMKNQMEELGADGYYMQHNHPTGRPEPSRADIYITDAIAEEIDGFMGHIIINNGEFALIHRNGAWSKGDIPKEYVTYDLNKPVLPHPVLEREISDPQMLAAVATEIYRPDSVAVIGTDPTMKVSGLSYLGRNEVGEFDELTTINFITTFMRQTGSNRVFISNLPNELFDSGIKLVESGFLMDFITENGMTPDHTTKRGQIKTRKGVMLLEEPTSDYFKKRTRPIVAFGKPEETLFDFSIRKIGDKFRMLKLLQREIIDKGGVIPEDANVYLSEEAFYGKAENDMNIFEDTFIAPMAKLMAEYDINQMELDSFLYAKHAPERNKAIAAKRDDMPDGGSGMSTAEAKKIIAGIEAEGKLSQYEQVSQYIYDLLKANREIIKKHGLEDDETIYAWEAAYEWYVPLKGLAIDEPENVAAGTGQGFNISGRETRSALGRRSRALSPSSYAIADGTKLIIRAQKNEVGNSLLRLIENNPNPDYWEVFTDENPDMKKGEVTRTDPKTGKKVKKVELVKVPMAMVSRQYFTTKRNGKIYYIKLKDPRIEHAMKNLGPQSNNFFIRALASYTRYLSMVNTSLNPEFMITNFARDIQTAIFNIMAEQTRKDGKLIGEKVATQAVKNVGLAMRTFYRNARGKDPKNKEWNSYLQDFLADGAKTGYFDMKDLPQIEKSISRMVTIASGGFKGTLLQSTQEAGKFIEDVNSAVENAIRLSTYVAARKAGVSRKAATSAAKNLTVNFNRKGEIGTTINALYMFANASIQGTANFARAIVNLKPKEKGQIPVYGRLNAAQKVAGGMIIFGYILAALGRAFGGEDEDGEKWWDKIPHYEKERNLIIMNSMWGGEEGEYRKIMLPYGYNIFPNIGYAVESILTGNKTPLEAGGDLAVTALGSFSPIGFAGSDDFDNFVLKNVSPTIIRPIVDIGINENFMGNTIYNVQPPYGIPEPQSSMGRKNTPEAYKQIAMFLNEISGGGEKITGWIDIAPESLEYMVSYVTGGAGNFVLNKVPQNMMAIINQEELPPQRILFYGKVAGEILPYSDISNFYDRLDETQQYREQAESLRGEERKNFIKENREKISLASMAETTSVQLRRLRKMRDRIEQSTTLTEKERKQRLESIEKQMKRYVDRFNKTYNERVK